MFGFTRDELLGSQLEMLVPENLRSQHRSHRTAYATSPQTRPLVRSTVPSGRRKDGSEFPAEVSLSSIDTSEGKLSVAFITDITERKRAEDEVRRSERNLRDVLDSLFAFVGVMSVDGTLIETNRAPLEAAGISKEDVVGKPFWEAFWWSYSSGVQARIRASMVQARSGEASRFDIDMQMADGQVMTIDFMIAPMRDSAGAISRLISSAVPITERKRAEEALRRSEARLRRITESNIVGVLYWDLDGRVLDANEAFLRLAGYTRDDLEHGRADWKAITPAEWAGGDARGVSQLQATGKFGPYEKEFIRRDGTRVYALLAAAMFDTEPNRGVTLALDITHRKEAEDGLLRANEDLQQFAWAASHDLQEPIRMVVTFTQMLARRYGTSLDADGLELLGFAEDGAKRMEVLLHDLREYWHLSGTIEDEQRQQVNLSSVIDEVLRGLDAAIAGTDTHVSGVEDMPTVMGHRTGLVQLFQNLIGNAIKYRHPDRPLRVRLTAEREAGFWKFGVIDNGIGFPPEYRDRIFGIFKRLHGRDQYPGTGIGLALCRKIVSRHGGTIWADSDGHTGSSICFTLPAGAYRELAD
jgi:PAS domain S-box-containing protein